jgi:hypothetical protein
MSDNDEARGMSDELKIEITAEDLRTAREMLRRSKIAHCFRCLNPAPPGPDPPGWGIMGRGQPPIGFFVHICPECSEAVDNWVCGGYDEILDYDDGHGGVHGESS